MDASQTEPRPDDSTVRVPVIVSAAHVHLTQAVIEELYCDRYRLHEHARLPQPTQYVAEESVTLIGPMGRVENVRVIGPPRLENQVELSQTDARALGIEVPVRRSGALEDTPGILIEGPRARVLISRGVIRVLRHIHMNPGDADFLGLRDQDRVEVTDEWNPRTILLRDVLVRVAPNYRLELHLDLDDGKDAGLRSGDHVLLRKRSKGSRAIHWLRKHW